ncbi:ABC transporter ATP-binding protein [Shinella pollutisoli]|uniref:Spermidine/putrescine import ATP-binding protein PotA n=1 Tax=Shinella pollutisoli TaxID=2250594 RepID=A0ABV7DF09_9HYPH|nr:ABC transporter ATP-binding protein [Shinella pollutisoli]
MHNPSQSGASLEISDLSKAYGSFKALDAVSLTARQGEFLSLLGPSGSGKTTTLNMIAGFTSPTSGEIRVDGREISTLPPYRRDIGIVFQHYALFPHLTAAQNIAFPLQRRGMPRRDVAVRVAEALEMVKLDGYGDRYPRQLSGGQQQRVAFARAVVFKPKLLLMDEPLGALDKKLREDLQGEIRRIHRSLGITFVFVTHDQEEALALSDRIAVFNHGRIEQIGTSRELYETPATEFVARFIGEANIFSGTLVRGDAGLALDTPVGLLPVETRLPAGRQASLVVRPERLEIGKAPHAGSDPHVPATVRDVVYLGSNRRIEIVFDDGRTGIIRGSGRGTDVGAGERIDIRWSIADGYVVPFSSSQTGDGHGS